MRSIQRAGIYLVMLLAIQLAFAGRDQCFSPSPIQAENVQNKPQRVPRESIQTLVNSLSSSDDATQTAAERDLLKLGLATPQWRKVVIKELLASVSHKPDLNGTHSVLTSEVFGYWKSVTTLFRELKASEGIDAMITCIHCSNGYSGNMGEPPASYSLVRMGEMAIPKLSQALLMEPDGYKRIKIVLCLSRIGGPQAKSALRKALSSEKDKTVREYIRSTL